MRWDLTGDVVVGEVNEFEVEAGEEWGEGAIEAVVVEVEEAELVKGGKGVHGAAEVEGREGECGHAAIDAFDANP